MAICKNCGADISPLAKVCPNCGMPQQVREEDPFDQTQAYIPNQGRPGRGNYNAQPAGSGYDNQPVGGYNNEPVNNYGYQPDNSNNNEPVNNYGYQPDNGNNNQPVSQYNNQSDNSYNNQPVNNYNDQPGNLYNNQPAGSGSAVNGGAGYGMGPMPAPRPIGGMIALSIVAILFCTIGGIVTLVKTVNINSAMTYAEQQARYASAKRWGIASIVIGIVIGIVIAIAVAALLVVYRNAG